MSSSISSFKELPARRGFSLVFDGKTLLSRIDPITQAERIIESLSLKERTLYFCPSPLYGYGLSRLLEKLKASPFGDSCAIICVEADEQLFELSKRNMKGLLDEGKKVLILAKLETNDGLCVLVRKTWGERSFRRVETLHLGGGWQLFPDLYEKTAGTLQRDIALAWSNAITLIRLGRLYIRNAIRNLDLLTKYEDISTFDFGAGPVLVLGAGPSMDIILDELKGLINNNKKPFKIICVDSSITSLKERGIKPDLAVVLESQHINIRAFLNARGWEIPIAADLSSLPASSRILGGETLLYMTPWTQLRLFNRLEQQGLLPTPLPPLGSVGLSAVELARRLGTGPIIIAGLDFSYTLDAHYARSSPAHLARLAKGNRFSSLLNAEGAFKEGSFSILSKSGLPVWSDPAMLNFRNLFENEFSSSSRFFEIKGPGLNLGVNTISLKEAVDILTGKRAYTASSISVNTERSFKKQKENKAQKETIKTFIKNEREYLVKLRDILTGKIKVDLEDHEDHKDLEELLDSLDYIWAHFPECAAAGGKRPDLNNLSFLKRVRVEIDPFLRLWDSL